MPTEASVRVNARKAAAMTVAKMWPAEFEKQYVRECELRGVEPYPARGRPRKNDAWGVRHIGGEPHGD